MFAKHLLRTGALTAAAATIGSIASKDADSRWYRSLDKPPFQPPATLFPIVWTALYADIAVVSAAVLNTWQRSADRASRAEPHVEPAPGHPADTPSHAVLHGHGHGADIGRSHHRPHSAVGTDARGIHTHQEPRHHNGGAAGTEHHDGGIHGMERPDSGVHGTERPRSELHRSERHVGHRGHAEGPVQGGTSPIESASRRQRRSSRRHRPDPARAARAARNGYRYALVRNMALNAAWSWVFFKGKNPAAATGVAALLAADTWALARRAGDAKPALGVALVPYAAWCSFATLLSGSIWARNPT